MPCCHLETERLLLRPPEAADVAAMLPLIGEYGVAKNLSRVPHPYREEQALEFLARVSEQRAAGTDYNFAIMRKVDGDYMGGCGVHLRDGAFEIGYWLGMPYWRQGYATEAARGLAAFAFRDLKATRLIAGWFHDNLASGHVLEKVGFVPDGAEQRDCLARGHAVYCHMVTLDRDTYGKQSVQ
jgi:[ribosomal protein S5]-alanine N-acetyltransferase